MTAAEIQSGLYAFAVGALRVMGSQDFYTPSPGQLYGHVDSRVARALIDVVWEEIERRTKDEQNGERETT